MKNSSNISDEAWLAILAGKQEADSNDHEQQQLKKIRNVLLEQHESMIENSTDFAAEQKRLLERIKQENKKKHEPFYKRLFNSNVRKNPFLPIFAMASLLVAVILPMIMQDKQSTTSNSLPEGMVYKGTEQKDEKIIAVSNPQKQLEILKNDFIRSNAFKSVTSKKEDDHFVLELEIDVEQVDKAIEMLKKNNIMQPYYNVKMTIIIKSLDTVVPDIKER